MSNYILLAATSAGLIACAGIIYDMTVNKKRNGWTKLALLMSAIGTTAGAFRIFHNLP